MKTLREFDINFGPTREGTPFIKHYSVLGHPVVAETLIEWSKKNERGALARKETGWGLKLLFIANEENPRVLMSLDETKLGTMMSSFGPVTSFHFIDYGLMVSGPVQKKKESIRGADCELSIALPLSPDESIVLHRWAGGEEEVPLGGIDIGESGFNYLTCEEVKAQEEEMSSWAAPKKSAGEEEGISPEEYAEMLAEARGH